VFEWRRCGHIQLLPMFSEKEHKDFYDKNLQDKARNKELNYRKLQENCLYDTIRHVKLIKFLHPCRESRILDIGSGYGFFANELHRNGYESILGVEISSERRDLALEHGEVQILNYDVDNPNGEIGKFDLVTLFHVLEHMRDPINFLKSIRKLLNPDGILLCEVPNVRELALDECQEYNDFYWIPAHLNYFSEKTLSVCFSKAGYGKASMRYEQRYGLINLCHWLETGKPQIKRPVFEILDAYKPVESFYREFLKSMGRADTLIAIGGQ